MNTEWVITHAYTVDSSVQLADTRSLWLHKPAPKNTNAEHRIEIRHVGGYYKCGRYRQVFTVCQSESFCLRAAT